MKKIIGISALAVLVLAVAWGLSMSKKGEESVVDAQMQNTTVVNSQNSETEDKAMVGEKEEIVSGTYVVDVEQSTAEWTASKKIVTDWVDSGTISVQEGRVEVAEDMMVSGKLVFDMSSIAVINTGAGEKGNASLEKHLKSADFFEVETYPSATFEITKVTPAQTANSYLATGNLTIKDISNEITVPLTAYSQDGALMIEGSVDVDRTLWNIKFGSDKFFDNLADNVINDEFSLKFSLVANATQE